MWVLALGVESGGFGDRCFPIQALYTLEAQRETGPATSCYALLNKRSPALVVSFSPYIFTSAGLSGTQRLPSLPFKGMLAI